MSKVDFVEKLMEILKDHDHVVQWNQDGTQFQIVDYDDFVKNILSTYFRHEKFESFIRQLNMYGFRKVNRKQGVYVFKHEHFRRDDKDSIRFVKRNKKNKKDVKPSNNKESELRKESIILEKEAPNLVEPYNKLISFTFHQSHDNRQLKSVIDKLTRELSAKKSRIAKPIISRIKSNISQIDETLNKILQLNWKAPETPKKVCQTQPLISHQEKPTKVMSTPQMNIFQRSEQSTLKQSGQKVHQPFSMNHFRSCNSISNFLEPFQ